MHYAGVKWLFIRLLITINLNKRHHFLSAVNLVAWIKTTDWLADYYSQLLLGYSEVSVP